MRWTSIAALVVVCGGACSDAALRPLGSTCGEDGDCESSLCLAQVCVDPLDDADKDGVLNRDESRVTPGLGADAATGMTMDASPGTGTGTASSGGDATHAPDPVTAIYRVELEPALDVSACGVAGTSLAQETIDTSDGRFDARWLAAGPNFVSFSGTTDDERLDAQISCSNGAQKAPLQAMWDGSALAGSIVFGTQTVSVRVTKLSE